MKGKKKQQWKSGDLFGIPLIGGGLLLGQILAAEPSVLNSVSCALFEQRFSDDSAPRPDLNRLVSVLLTTRDLLDSGHWRTAGASDIEIRRELFPFESLRSAGFVGAKVIGSRNVGVFANAFCGLSPWDNFADTEYFERLLISNTKKPQFLIYKSNE